MTGPLLHNPNPVTVGDTVTKREARDILKWFQKHIGLLGWTVNITIGDPPKELGGVIPPDRRPDFYGTSSALCQFHRAYVWINSDSHDGSQQMVDGEEETLLHELLHCWWTEVGMEEGGEQCEWANNRLARVLLKQYRSDHGQA